MRKGAIAVTLIVAAVGVAVVGSRGCSRGEKGGPSSVKSASPKAVDLAAALRDRGVSPSASASASSAAQSPTGAGPAGPDLVFSSPWGGQSLDQVGRSRPSEANPEGPMSVTVD